MKTSETPKVSREDHFRDLARKYLWGDYVDAESEFEEVEALVSLLWRVRTAAIEEALKVMREEGLGPFVLRHVSRKLVVKDGQTHDSGLPSG